VKRQGAYQQGTRYRFRDIIAVARSLNKAKNVVSIGEFVRKYPNQRIVGSASATIHQECGDCHVWQDLSPAVVSYEVDPVVMS
jgi:hypothetical protein